MVSDGDAPPINPGFVNDLNPIQFISGADRDVRFSIPLDRYSAGDQIKLTVRGYCSSTGNVVFESIASLYETGSDWTAAPTNQRTNSQTVAMPGTANFGFISEVLEITDGSGEINSVALAAQDMLTVNLKRNRIKWV